MASRQNHFCFFRHILSYSRNNAY